MPKTTHRKVVAMESELEKRKGQFRNVRSFSSSSPSIPQSTSSKNTKPNHRTLTSSRVHKLHRLVKKQTSLVGVTVISSWIIWFGAAAFDAKFAMLVPLDCILNCLAMWLMLSFTQKYWNFIDEKCCKCKFWHGFTSADEGEEKEKEKEKEVGKEKGEVEEREQAEKSQSLVANMEIQREMTQEIDLGSVGSGSDGNEAVGE